MTPQEFRAWFEGFAENIEGQPTKAQWAKIKKRVGEIDGIVTTYPVFVDRYWQYGMPYWARSVVGVSAQGTGGPPQNALLAGSAIRAQAVAAEPTLSAKPWDAGEAMRALGLNDARELRS